MIRINLLPAKAAKKRDTAQQQVLAFFLAILLAGGGMYGWYYFTEEEVDEIQNQVTAAQKQLAALKKSAGDLSQYEAREKDLKERLDQIESLQKSKGGPVRMLAELSRRIPSRVWLDHIDEKDRKMTLKGAGLSYDDVSEFVRALRESGYFINVQYKGQEEKPSPIPGMNFVEFSLICETKYAI
jgi:type IV pilus assembly protein PilN